MALTKRKHTDVMRAHLPMAGRKIADIGCGDGSLARFMTREGAQVIGIEASEAQLARARAADRSGAEQFLLGRGEALELPDECLDGVVYFNALHHLPPAMMDKALEEAARVLKPGGILYVQEPLAKGDYFELMRPIEDETAVRRLAHEAVVHAAAGPLFERAAEVTHDAPINIASFGAFLEGLLQVDPGRRAAIDRHRDALRAQFDAHAEADGQAFRFYQPSRVDLLRRRAQPM